MFLPWPEEKDIKVYANETQQALATINRCLIRLLDNDKFLYNSINFFSPGTLDTSALTADVIMANKYIVINVGGDPGNPALSGTTDYLVPLYKYDS
jgi:hypothetical protein